VPIYVLPPKGAVKAPIVFLASTFTYQIYANHRRGNADEAFRARQAEWGAYPWKRRPASRILRFDLQRASGRQRRLPFEHAPADPNDAAGLHYLSRRARLRSAAFFPADTHLIDWFAAKGIAYDVCHRPRSRTAKASIYCGRIGRLVTGSHPEYHTPNTLNALQEYVGNGGRLAYLGGNGFYWRIANSTTIPDVVEVPPRRRRYPRLGRRARRIFSRAGWRLWRLWAPQRSPAASALLASASQPRNVRGVILPAHARRDRSARVMDLRGRSTTRFSAISACPAAELPGFELDRADFKLGTPPNALILARSEAHQKPFRGRTRKNC